MKSPLSFWLLIAALGLSVGAVHAEKADRSKPMNVEADALRHDEQKQTSVFTGRVILTKGSIVIRGARIEVRQDAQGNQFGLVSAEPGKLAFYRQKREGVDEYIEGEAETIEYDGRADTVKFIKQAQLRRYRGATLNDELTGHPV
jgi:lipopolysaccharide export system protein LptA